MKKQIVAHQQYDNYWKLTVEYSNINGTQFTDTLRLIVNFIDNNEKELINCDPKKLTELYGELQQEVGLVFKKVNQASTRKSINQFVKLGFIKPKLMGYHRLSKRFLNAVSDEERILIFSEVYYSSASFNSSVTKDFTDRKEINFLLKTLMYHPEKKLREADIVSLMNTDVTKIKNGYLTKEQLDSKYKFSKLIKFEEKKYNQISFFYNFLELVPGIIVSNRDVMYKEDAANILEGKVDTKRDPTLFRIMKENLKRESRKLYDGKEVCYFTKMPTKALVTSHIWRSEDALKEMDVEAAYDYKNALLLEQNIDSYFDKYDLSFKADGKPLFGSEFDTKYKEFKLKHIDDSLDKEILSDDRLWYLEKHNKEYYSKLRSK